VEDRCRRSVPKVRMRKPEIRFDAADTDVGSRPFDGTPIAN